MNHKMPRRTVLSLFITGFLGACSNGDESADSRSQTSSKVSEPSPRQDLSSKAVFQHGVASGDPDHDSVVIWTRISTPEAQEAEVVWEAARDKSFSKLVSRGSQRPSSNSDFTIKVVLSKLEAGETYYYRFIVGNAVSPVGHTKTLPKGAVDRFGIALASCSNFAFGFFNAYDAIARDPDIDLVLHTGDYIYEYAADGWGSETASKLGRVHEPANEIVSLEDYRTRHAQYKTDKGAQAMHAAHPFICCWDDHESTNNPWVGGAQNHQPDKEGDWLARRNASVQAYFEWMPIRDPIEVEKRIAFSRVYEIGNLASLVTLESRHTARAEQIDYADYAEKLVSDDDFVTFKKSVLGKQDRRMISAKTEDLVRSTFSQSIETNKPWRLLGNASPIAKMLVPDVEKSGALEGETVQQLATDAAKHLIWKGKHNLPFYTDTWDGYPWAREEFYNACKDVGATDLLFLTGDSHSFWVNQLAADDGMRMGIELGTAGISSPGDFVESGWSADVAEKLDRLFEDEVDEVMWTDNFHQGYVRVVLSQKSALASFVAVSSVLTTDYATRIIKQVSIGKDSQVLDLV